MGNCTKCGLLFDNCLCAVLRVDPLLAALGRAIAPKVNACLAELDKELAERKRHPLDAK